MRDAERAGCPQHFQLIGQRQAVAGLDFYRGDTVGAQALQARCGEGNQLGLGGGAGGRHGGENAAAGLGGFRIADTAETRLELGAAVAGEDQVRVAVDQARGEPAAADIVVLGGRAGEVSGQIGTPADPQDAAVGNGHGAVRDCAIGAGARSHRGDTTALPDRIRLHAGPLYPLAPAA